MIVVWLERVGFCGKRLVLVTKVGFSCTYSGFMIFAISALNDYWLFSKLSWIALSVFFTKLPLLFVLYGSWNLLWMRLCLFMYFSNAKILKGWSDWYGFRSYLSLNCYWDFPFFLVNLSSTKGGVNMFFLGNFLSRERY